MRPRRRGSRRYQLPADTREQMQFSYADTLKMSSRFAEAEQVADDLLSQQRARLGPRHRRPVIHSCCSPAVARLIQEAGHTSRSQQIP
jgi:hypothetical protein